LSPLGIVLHFTGQYAQNFSHSGTVPDNSEQLVTLLEADPQKTARPQLCKHPVK